MPLIDFFLNISHTRYMMMLGFGMIHWILVLFSTWLSFRSYFFQVFVPPHLIWAHGVQAQELQISAFSQLDGETSSQAWFRLGDIMLGCPQHRFEIFRLIQIFYDGLRVDAHDFCRGDEWRYIL